MFIYNYHTHTYRCGHAIGSDEEYVEAAIKAGYKVLGFSDHAPYSQYYHANSSMRWDQLEEYISSIDQLKEKYQDQIRILTGLESDYYAFCHEEHKALSERLDYFLLGQHFSHPSGSGANYFAENSEEEIREYTGSLIAGLHTGFYDYLCHPDVIMSRQPRFTPALEEAAHRIAQACVETDTPLELNVRGVMKGRKQFEHGIFYNYPHRDFWKIMSEYPIRVTIGIDAHAPKDLLDTYLIDEGMKELSDFHLSYITEPFI